jgi:hypothetical protein
VIQSGAVVRKMVSWHCRKRCWAARKANIGFVTELQMQSSGCFSGQAWDAQRSCPSQRHSVVGVMVRSRVYKQNEGQLVVRQWVKMPLRGASCCGFRLVSSTGDTSCELWLALKVGCSMRGGEELQKRPQRSQKGAERWALEPLQALRALQRRPHGPRNGL